MNYGDEGNVRDGPLFGVQRLAAALLQASFLAGITPPFRDRRKQARGRQSGGKPLPSTIAPRSCDYALGRRLQNVVRGEIAQVSEQLQNLLAELRGRFEALYGTRLVRLVLFGSRARGDAEPGSDIDVLVVLEGPVRAGEEIRRSLDDVAELSLENNVVFSCVFVSRDRFENELSPMLINVRREGVPV